MSTIRFLPLPILALLAVGCPGTDGDDDTASDDDTTPGELDMDQAYGRWLAEAAEDLAGRSVSMGDVDGDGIADLVIGAPYNAEGGDMAGAVYVVTDVTAGDHGLQDATAKLVGEGPEDRAGKTLSATGDTDGDGAHDLVIGAPYNDAGGADAGAVYVTNGAVTGSVDLATADAKLVGESPGDYAGCYVISDGDVDADGFDDVLAGAYSEGTGGVEAGAVYLVSGPVSGQVDLAAATAKVTGESAGDHLGYSMSCGCDVDADGHDDVLVGAYGNDAGGNNAGAAYLFHGPLTGTHVATAAAATLVGAGVGHVAGYASACAGDTDGDGFDDLLVGAYNAGAPPSGAAYLVRGPLGGAIDLGSADATVQGEAEGDRLGFHLTGAGDVNADGLDDILIGAPWASAQAGYAWLIYGPLSGPITVPDLRLSPEDLLDSDRLGLSVSCAGDADADGFDDILVGAPRLDEVGHDAGAAYVVLGGGM